MEINEMKIYVADLQDYNSGLLYGKWFNLEDFEDASELQEAVEEMLQASPNYKEDVAGGYGEHEEWAIHDFELPWKISECEGFEAIYTVFNVYKEALENYEMEVIQSFIDWLSEDVEEGMVAKMDERYAGTYKDRSDWAYEYMSDCMEVPEHLENYIDYDAFARDAECGDMYFDQVDHETCICWRNC